MIEIAKDAFAWAAANPGDALELIAAALATAGAVVHLPAWVPVERIGAAGKAINMMAGNYRRARNTVTDTQHVVSERPKP